LNLATEEIYKQNSNANPKMSRRKNMLNKKIIKSKIKVKTGSNLRQKSKQAHQRVPKIGGERRQ